MPPGVLPAEESRVIVFPLLKVRARSSAGLLAATCLALLAAGCTHAHSASASGSHSGRSTQGQSFTPSKNPKGREATHSAMDVLTNDSATGLPSAASDNGTYIPNGRQAAEAVPAAPVPGEKYQPRPDPPKTQRHTHDATATQAAQP